MATFFRWIFRLLVLKAGYALFNRYFGSGQRRPTAAVEADPAGSDRLRAEAPSHDLAQAIHSSAPRLANAR